MTTKEAQKMRRLELENEELRAQLSKHMRVYGETLGDLVTLQATLSLVREAVQGDIFHE